MTPKARITRITIGRLYNLGSYEHVRYELTVEIPENGLVSETFQGLERLFVALNPRAPSGVAAEHEITRDKRRLEHMKELLGKGEEEFRRENTYFVGTSEEYIARCEESLNKAIKSRQDWEARSKKAREMLEDLGGAAKWHDAKLEWDDDDF